MGKMKVNNYVEKEKELIEKQWELIETISNIRKSKNMSQRDLCSLINMSQPMLAKIEKGKNSPTLETILKILSPLGYTLTIEKND